MRLVLVFFCPALTPSMHSNWITQKFALNFKCNFGNAFNQANGQTNLKIALNGFFNLNAPHFEWQNKKTEKYFFQFIKSRLLHYQLRVVHVYAPRFVCQTMDHYFNFSWRSMVFAHIQLFIRSIRTGIRWHTGFSFSFLKIKSMRWISVLVSLFGVCMRDAPQLRVSMCLCLFEWRCVYFDVASALFPKLFHLLNSRRRRRRLLSILFLWHTSYVWGCQ